MEKRFSFDRDQVNKMLSAHRTDLNVVLMHGFQDSLEIRKGYARRSGSSFSPSCLAHIAWECIKNRADEFFAENSLIKPAIHSRNFGLMVGENLFLRLKKVDRNLNWSNVQTRQQIQMNSQAQIDGFPKAPQILVVGYQFDETSTSIKSIHVIYAKKKIFWAIDLLKEYSETPVMFHTEENVDITGEPQIVMPKKKFKGTANG